MTDRMASACVGLALALLGLAGCASSDGAAASSPTPYVFSTPTPSGPQTDEYTTQRIECRARPSTGDIVVRETGPDIEPNALELGGGYVWGEDTNECVTTVQMVLDTAPAENCEQVALAKDNPGYDTDARPPARLKKIIASSDAC